MVAGKPAGGRGDVRHQLAERFVGFGRTVLGKVAGSQHQIDARLFLQHLVDHPAQAVAGFHAQQLAVCFGEQVAVG